MKPFHFYLICFLVILIDQVTKVSVHHFMVENQDIKVIGDWFRLHYILNEGMAFGIKMDSKYGKLFLSLFRIIAISGLGYFFYKQIHAKANKYLLISLALILGGAIGNGIDSVFYGVIFDNASHTAITPWLHGQVIDMLYFPLFNGRFPSWLPLIGGNHFSFFSAIFNLADTAIFIGALSIIVFHNRMFADPEAVEEEQSIVTPSSLEMEGESSINNKEEEE